jgi:hypothetical protein
MSSSLSALLGFFRLGQYEYVPLRDLCQRSDKVTVAGFSVAGGRSAALNKCSKPIVEMA